MMRQAEMKDFKSNILREIKDSYGHCSSGRLLQSTERTVSFFHNRKRSQLV